MIAEIVVLCIVAAAFYILGGLVGRHAALEAIQAWCRAEFEATGDEAYHWCDAEIERMIYHRE